MRILIAEDEPGLLHSLTHLLKDEHEVFSCQTGLEALEVIEKNGVDLILSDNQMPGLTGLELLKRVKSQFPETHFILMTSYGTVESAVEAMRAQADDYLLKPIELKEVQKRVNRFQEIKNYEMTKLLSPAQGAARILGSSPLIVSARNFIKKVAETHSPVLILGASGTGKEVLARSIHEEGKRLKGPFVAINCASLNEGLLESELFGHEKGSFTGATQSKQGKFEIAQDGTLFLDEVGELAPGLQAKLLRVLQEREFTRVGGVRVIKTNARVITATHRNLEAMVKSGQFREDLYFRLNVLHFEMPMLSERAEDIPMLVDYFWNFLGQELGRKMKLSQEVKDELKKYSFPGNVRELKNLLERTLVLTPSSKEAVTWEIVSTFLHRGKDRRVASPLQVVPGAGVPTFSEKGGKTLVAYMDELESQIIRDTLEKNKQNQNKTARILGLSRGALQYKMRKYGLEPKQEGEDAA